MGNQYKRYTVAWVPVPGTPLAEFGAGWTGFAAETGKSVEPRADLQDLRAAAKVNCYPGRFGLRAPLTTPFQLRDGLSQWAFESILEEFASRHCSAQITVPEVRVINDQVTQISPQPHPGLTRMIPDLQDTIAPHIQPEAAPQPTRFGFPLTGIVAPRVAGQLRAVLGKHLEGITGTRPLIASISLVGDPGDGQGWQMLHRYPLTGLAEPKAGVPDAMAIQGPDLLAPITGTGLRRQGEIVVV